MKLGFIGLGRMGRTIVLHLLEQGIEVVVYNRTRERTDELVTEFESLSKDKSGQNTETGSRGKLTPAYTYRELLENLEGQRIIWIMVEHGAAVDEVIDNLMLSGCRKDDIVIDGGNSFYKDSIRRFNKLKERGVNFLDVGTSGGIEGARNGACLMVGGDEEVFEKVKPILEKIAVVGGLAYFGPTGAGHFVKMIHNGVEYGMIQAIGEGFEILAKKINKVDLRSVVHNWKHGSVVRGWLIELLETALVRDPELKEFSGSVGGGSTGEWTIDTAKELMVDTPVISAAVSARKKSKVKPTYAGKVVSALRQEFGGHSD